MIDIYSTLWRSTSRPVHSKKSSFNSVHLTLMLKRLEIVEINKSINCISGPDIFHIFEVT